MGNYSRINIEELLEEYGIKFTGKESKGELERIKLAFESVKDMDEFVKQVKEILKHQ